MKDQERLQSTPPPTLQDAADVTAEEAVIGLAKQAPQTFVAKVLSDKRLTAQLCVLQKDDPAIFTAMLAELRNTQVLSRDVAALERAIAKENKKADNEWHELIAEQSKHPRLLEIEHCYYKQVYGRTHTKQQKLSNFTIVIHERVMVEMSGEVVDISVLIGGKERTRLQIPQDALLSRMTFLRKIGLSNLAWFGDDKDLQLLRDHIAKMQCPVRKGIDWIGRIDGRIVLPNMTLDKSGRSEDAPVRFAGLDFSGVSRNAVRKCPSDQSHLGAAKAVFQRLSRINESNIMVPALSWVFALPWCGMIRAHEQWGGFPHLVLWGSAGAGKTATASILGAAGGLSGNVDPFALPQTPFARLRLLSSTNLLPIIMDEFRPSSWNQKDLVRFIHQLRSTYNGEIDRRGMRDQGMREYPLMAPVMIVGEDRPRNAALDDRIICLNLSPSTIKRDSAHFQHFMDGQGIPLWCFAPQYWSWCLGQDDWLSELQSCRELVANWIEEKIKWPVPNRIANNLAILCFGRRKGEQYARQLGVDVAELDEDRMFTSFHYALSQVMPDGRRRVGFDHFVDLFSTMVANGRAVLGQHYAVSEKRWVILPLSQVVPEVHRYARETDDSEPLLQIDALRAQVREMDLDKDSYVKAVSVVGSFLREGEDGPGRQRRGVGLCIRRMKEVLGIDEDVWDRDTVEGIRWDDKLDKP